MGDVERSVSRARLKTAAIALSSFLGAAVLGAVLTRSVGPIGTLLPALMVAGLSLHAYRERRQKLPVVDQQTPAPTVGMRRPTPINRPFNKQPRPESGTRFKAVRLSDRPKKAEEG
jgi:hypothetical protein